MKTRLLLLTLSVYLYSLSVCIGQQADEIKEFQGTIKDFDTGYYFAYEYLVLETKEGLERFQFYPYYGELIKQNFSIGDQVSVKVKINNKMREGFAKLSEERRQKTFSLRRENITEIKIKNEWVSLPSRKETFYAPVFKTFLDQKITDFYIKDDFKTAAFFKNGIVGFSGGIGKFYDPLKNSKVGDDFSFTGYYLPFKKGYVYPINTEINSVYTISPLVKREVHLVSYLHKQNFVCIGAKFLTRDESIIVSFPSDKAKEIKEFIRPELPVIIYHGAHNMEGLMEGPEMHAIIQENDTLILHRFNFYGGSDVAHEHKPVQLEGKVKDFVKTNKGRVLGLIVDHQFFVEIDPRLEKQIGPLLKKGLAVAVEGNERIKKSGEIYSKDYRIVTPDRVTIDGKTFSINPLP
jgi:hypothetical protein